MNITQSIEKFNNKFLDFTESCSKPAPSDIQLVYTEDLSNREYDYTYWVLCDPLKEDYTKPYDQPRCYGTFPPVVDIIDYQSPAGFYLWELLECLRMSFYVDRISAAINQYYDDYREYDYSHFDGELDPENGVYPVHHRDYYHVALPYLDELVCLLDQISKYYWATVAFQEATIFNYRDYNKAAATYSKFVRAQNKNEILDRFLELTAHPTLQSISPLFSTYIRICGKMIKKLFFEPIKLKRQPLKKRSDDGLPIYDGDPGLGLRTSYVNANFDVADAVDLCTPMNLCLELYKRDCLGDKQYTKARHGMKNRTTGKEQSMYEFDAHTKTARLELMHKNLEHFCDVVPTDYSVLFLTSTVRSETYCEDDIKIQYKQFMKFFGSFRMNKNFVGFHRYFRAFELQDRGSLHLHTLIALPLELVPSAITCLSRLKRRHGLGRTDLVVPRNIVHPEGFTPKIIKGKTLYISDLDTFQDGDHFFYRHNDLDYVHLVKSQNQGLPDDEVNRLAAEREKRDVAAYIGKYAAKGFIVDFGSSGDNSGKPGKKTIDNIVRHDFLTHCIKKVYSFGDFYRCKDRTRRQYEEYFNFFKAGTYEPGDFDNDNLFKVYTVTPEIIADPMYNEIYPDEYYDDLNWVYDPCTDVLSYTGAPFDYDDIKLDYAGDFYSLRYDAQTGLPCKQSTYIPLGILSDDDLMAVDLDSYTKSFIYCVDHSRFIDDMIVKADVAAYSDKYLDSEIKDEIQVSPLIRAEQTIKRKDVTWKLNKGIPKSIADNYPINLHELQKQAIDNAIHNKIVLINGMAGTGKTYTALNCLQILNDIHGKDLRVNVAVPTHAMRKAWTELLSGIPNSSAHELTSWLGGTNIGNVIRTSEIQYNKLNKECEVLVLDEIFMSSKSQLDRFFERVELMFKKHKLKCVLLLGDPDQIQKVDFRFNNVVTLKENYRSTGAVKDLCYQVAKLDDFSVQTDCKEFNIEEFRGRDVQILTQSRKTARAINNLIDSDKYMVANNHYRLTTNGGDMIRVTNGTALKLLRREKINDRKERLYFEIMDDEHAGEVIRYLNLEENKEFIKATAITVHKSQGRQFDHVVYVVDSCDLPTDKDPIKQAEKIARYKKLLYTALSRAKISAEVRFI